MSGPPACLVSALRRRLPRVVLLVLPRPLRLQRRSGRSRSSRVGSAWPTPLPRSAFAIYDAPTGLPVVGRQRALNGSKAGRQVGVYHPPRQGCRLSTQGGTSYTVADYSLDAAI